MKLNVPEVLKWCEALESGGYSQATERLKRDDGFCCLGIACDISGLGHWDHFTPNSTRDSAVYSIDGMYSATTFMPLPVRNHYGLCDDLELTLTRMNDDEGKTFPEIAAYLRELVAKQEASA